MRIEHCSTRYNFYTRIGYMANNQPQSRTAFSPRSNLGVRLSQSQNDYICH